MGDLRVIRSFHPREVRLPLPLAATIAEPREELEDVR
jgi:hypothetical protein